MKSNLRFSPVCIGPQWPPAFPNYHVSLERVFVPPEFPWLSRATLYRKLFSYPEHQ